MKICVTGSNGYLGSVLCPILLQAGYEIVGLDNLMYDQFTLAECFGDPKFTFVRGDCRDLNLINELLKKADVFIPLAAIVGAPACNGNLDHWEINYSAIERVLYEAKFKTLVPTTNSGYGIGGASQCTEDSPLNPISSYGRSKVAAEKEVLNHGGISLRLATLFGMSPRMRTDLLLNDFVFRAMRDRYAVLYQAHFRRNFLDVRDAASVILWAIDHFDEMKGRPYNVGLPDANLTKRELCERIKAYVPDFWFCEAPVGEDPDKRDYLVDNSRILATGWRPRYSLDDGIRELVKGYEILKGERFGNV